MLDITSWQAAELVHRCSLQVPDACTEFRLQRRRIPREAETPGTRLLLLHTARPLEVSRIMW